MLDHFADQRAHDMPVAQHHHAVAALLDLMQAVRDEDDADAARLELGDDPQQPCPFPKG